MIEILILSVILGLAIANLSHVLTEIDLFEKPRTLLGKIPVVGKVFTCKFCQSNWMALALSVIVCWNVSSDQIWVIWKMAMPLELRILVLWQAMHWISRIAHKVEDGIPITAVANVNVNGQGSGS